MITIVAVLKPDMKASRKMEINTYCGGVGDGEETYLSISNARGRPMKFSYLNGSLPDL